MIKKNNYKLKNMILKKQNKKLIKSLEIYYEMLNDFDFEWRQQKWILSNIERLLKNKI
ncbi:MAG: hypothetical protein U9Q30_07395 [Campylobacterota bacterium]|nr:hypothetical protein [Campylobacterota bacterium]